MGIESFFKTGTAVIVIGFREEPEAVSERLLGSQGETPSYAFRGIVRGHPPVTDAIHVGYGHHSVLFGGTPVVPTSVALANALKDSGLMLRSLDDSGEAAPLTYVVIRVDKDRIDRVFNPATFERELMTMAVAILREARKPAN